MNIENRCDNPEWFVIIENINTNKIEKYNIFNHEKFIEECDKVFNECIYHIDAFKEFETRVKDELAYYFWGKREWEITIQSVYYDENKSGAQKKIDVYGQITLNWSRFIEYLWEYFTFNL